MKQALVVSNTVIAAETHEIILQTKTSFAFTPGQYITVIIPLADGKKVGRSYSIVSLKNNRIVLVVKLVEGGLASAYWQGVKEGDAVSFVGPAGKFLLSSFADDFLFVATGVGVTPFVSMIGSLLPQNDKQITLLLGFRHEEDVVYEKQFRDWEKEHPHFHCILTLSKPQDVWRGEKGRVTEYLLKHKEIMKNKQVYICGNGSMVQDVANICLENGVGKDHIFFEKYNNF